MQDYAEHSKALIEQIDAGDLNPADVNIGEFVENDNTVLTPALAKRLPDEKIQEYNDRINQRFESSLQDEQRDRTAEQQEALQILKGAVDDEERTESVPIGEAEVKVTVAPSGVLERKAIELETTDSDGINSVSEFDDYIELTLDVIRGFVVDERLRDSLVWRDYYDEYGVDGLETIAEAVMRPYQERQNELFRGGEVGRGDRSADDG